MSLFSIAGVQMNVAFQDVAANLQSMRAHLLQCAADGVRLTIFPECSATGYCFESRAECAAVAEEVSGPICTAMIAACREARAYAVFGMVERAGDDLFNAAVLTGPRGVEAVYRKVHLPYLGLDMFTTPGNRPFAVTEIEGVRIGLNICYDSAFPESSRCLALQGADLIVLPTNWPPGAECLARTAIATRAMENAVYYAAINRIGTERGFRFIGQSSICAPDGSALATADHTDAAVLRADVDVSRARRKHFVRVPGKHEIDRFADRRPELYRPLLTPHGLPTPRDRHHS